jgi:Uma2 family endonuclease
MVPARYKFTLEAYHRLGEMGFFGEDDRIELLEGEIVEMTPIGRLHAACVNRVMRRLEGLGQRAVVSVQNPLLVGDSELLPDIVLLSYRDDFYAAKAAAAEDALLIIEVADSSLHYDQTVKAPLYAQAGVPELWVIDRNDDLVWVHLESSDKGYLSIKAHQRGACITPRAFEAIPLNVNDILG